MQPRSYTVISIQNQNWNTVKKSFQNLVDTLSFLPIIRFTSQWY